MQLTIKKKIGKETYTFLVDGKNLHDLIMESKKLSFGNVEKCGLCSSDNLILDGRIAGPKKFAYAEIRCLDCKGSLTFGRTTEDLNVFYLRKEETGDKDKEGKAVKRFAWKEFGKNVDE